MKNITKFSDFSLETKANEELLNKAPKFDGFKNGVSKDEWKKFGILIREFNFSQAFAFAQEVGIFGGDFDDYLESRSAKGGATKYIIDAYSEYEEAASILAEEMLEDLQDAQNDYGH